MVVTANSLANLEMEMATQKRTAATKHQRTVRPQGRSQKKRPSLIPGLDPALLATQLHARVPMIKAVTELKEKSQVVTQEVLLLEFNY
jgi:hypothetical protein